MKNALKIIGIIILVGAIVGAGLFVESWILMKLVNWVLSLFEIAFALTFKQAFGMSILLSVIGGFFKKSVSITRD